MAEEIPAPRTPEWWVDRLSTALDEKIRQIAVWETYYDGPQPCPQPNPGSFQAANERAREAWYKLSKAGVSNWVSLVADAPADRLHVDGFQFGTPRGRNARTDDDKAWKLWQGNQLDADHELTLATALQVGSSYMTVWPNPDNPVAVDILPEHPSQMIIAYEPGSRRRRAAALKRFIDDDGFVLATLMLPEAIYKFRSERQAVNVSSKLVVPVAVSAAKPRWLPRDVPDEPWPLPNPMRLVPAVEFRANPSLKPSEFGGGFPEFHKVLSIQDRINKTNFDRMVTAEEQAFRQRYVIGWDFPTIVNDKGETVPDRGAILQAGASKMWAFKGVGDDPSLVKVGELGQADFSGFVKANDSDVQALAAISKTPPHYLLGQMVNISGDALKAAEAGLIAKAQRHSRNFGESLEEVIRLALLAVGDRRGNDVQSMVQWGDMELRTWSETVDAVTKMMQLPIPPDADWLLERLPEVTPQLVKKWAEARQTDPLTVLKALDHGMDAIEKGVLSPDELRSILNKLGAGLTGPPPEIRELPKARPPVGAMPSGDSPQ